MYWQWPWPEHRGSLHAFGLMPHRDVAAEQVSHELQPALDLHLTGPVGEEAEALSDALST